MSFYDDFTRQIAPKTKNAEEDKASWLDPALTAAGAIIGTIVAPGPGTIQGAQMGHAVGQTGHQIANGQVDPMSIMNNAMSVYGGAKSFQTPQTEISPNAGANPPLPQPEFQMPQELTPAQTLLEMYRSNPAMFQSPPRAYAQGGPVNGLATSMQDPQAYLQQVLQQRQQEQPPAGFNMTPEQINAILDRFGGQKPTEPSVDNGQLGRIQQASHPTLEALSGVAAQLLAAMPRPADPRNTKAIGAWLPAAGLALSAPAAVAQSRRASANAPIEQANTTARSDYEAKRKAYEDRKTKISDTLVGNATKPFAERAGDARITKEEALRFKHPEWEGMTREDARLAMQGAPDKPKPVEPPSPKEKAGLANMLADNIRQDKDVSNFMVVRDYYSRIARMAAGGSGVDDMSLIFAYMKVLDPTSVVRESEYKNAADAIGKIPQLMNIPANWMVGSKLTPEGRAGFLRSAKALYEQQRMSYRTAIDMYRGFATEFGIDPRLVIRNYEVQDLPNMGGGQAVPAGPSIPAAGRRDQ